MNQTKIAIQGVAGAFHEMAARKFYGDNIDIIECDTFKLLCQKLDKGEADAAVMAIENTIAGSLLPNYGLIDSYKLRIIGEVYLRIQMNLMALPGVKLSDIKYIYSHPIALAQCAEFLATLPNDVKITSADDTAESAKIIAEQGLTNTAAIAGVAAAELYKLNILEHGIETNKQNYTRFMALSNQAADVTQSNKASLSFELRHHAGALVEALTIFAKHNINLTKIQSVPILGKPYQYTFHVDVEWENKTDYDKVLVEMLKNVFSLKVYGEYQKGNLQLNY